MLHCLNNAVYVTYIPWQCAFRKKAAAWRSISQKCGQEASHCIIVYYCSNFDAGEGTMCSWNLKLIASWTLLMLSLACLQDIWLKPENHGRVFFDLLNVSLHHSWKFMILANSLTALIIFTQDPVKRMYQSWPLFVPMQEPDFFGFTW